MADPYENLANAIVLQYNAWSTQRTAQRLEHEARTLVQTTWRIPMVLDPVAQAKKQAGSTTSNSNNMHRLPILNTQLF